MTSEPDLRCSFCNLSFICVFLFSRVPAFSSFSFLLVFTWCSSSAPVHRLPCVGSKYQCMHGSHTHLCLCPTPERCNADTPAASHTHTHACPFQFRQRRNNINLSRSVSPIHYIHTVIQHTYGAIGPQLEIHQAQGAFNCLVRGALPKPLPFSLTTLCFISDWGDRYPCSRMWLLIVSVAGLNVCTGRFNTEHIENGPVH